MNVKSTAVVLEKKLDAAAKEFFRKATPYAFETFKMGCNAAITKAEGEFQTHRGVWKEIDALLTSVLNAFKKILNLPASPYTKQTDSLAKLGTFKEAMSRIKADNGDESDHEPKSPSGR